MGRCNEGSGLPFFLLFLTDIISRLPLAERGAICYDGENDVACRVGFPWIL
ncbi:MAG: hypothetical protein Q4D98_12555 [Planctomycetia bacterium]|nr:hypothetical protein [Planctomycetia bacterium]